MPGIALGLLALYGSLAIGLRVLVQLRRTGSTGFNGLAGDPGSAEWFGGLLLGVSVLLTLAGPILDLAGALDPIDALDGTGGHATGVVLAVGGIVATVAAQFAMGDAWRIGVDASERTELVTDGPFSVVRNPIFAAMIPAFWGIVLLVPNVVTIAGAVTLVVALELQTRLTRFQARSTTAAG